jgi:hypothetical protein
MKTAMFAFAAAMLLPLSIPSSAQVPAPIDLDVVQPISGSWVYRSLPAATEADFVDAAGTVRLMMRCNRAGRTVSLIRTGVPAAAPSLTVWTSSASRSIPSSFQSTKELSATLAATDALLDAIAFSRGRFATGAAGAPMVAVPVWAELTRVVEDCRS